MPARISTVIMLILVLICPGCSLGAPDRTPDRFDRQGDSSSGRQVGTVTCPTPPKEIQIEEVRAEADVLAYKIGQLVKAEVRGGVTPQRIRQELNPKVANWEVIDYRMCVHYADGVLDRDDYRRFLTEIAPTLHEISPLQSTQPSDRPNTHLESHGFNSPNVENTRGDVRIDIGTPLVER